jgi:hypothetical protein
MGVRGATLYGLGLLYGIVNVVTGESPAWSLMFAPIPLCFTWLYLQTS